MGVCIEELRIRNYKCYENVDIKLNESNLLLGVNNVGKTSLLEALELCFLQYKRVNGDIIFVKKDEILSKDKVIILDVLIGSDTEEFDDKWFDLFGELIFEKNNNQYIGLRTTIKYNRLKGDYEIEKKGMNDWPDSQEVESFENFSTQRITKNLIEAFPVFYLDAKRDIVSEMSDKFLYFGKLVKDIKLSEASLEEMERHLNEINDNIVENSEVLKHLSNSLNEISQVLDSGESSIQINPVSRKIKDLNQGMEIRFTDKNSESFSIANQGMGTRSWATFLTLSAYIKWKNSEMENKDIAFHPILLLEEPEAHLHPQAQRKIYKQMNNLKGQKIISTHSPIIASQANIDEIIHVYKKYDHSNTNHILTGSLKKNEIRKIKEEVFKTRGDVLFADILILCEGETEDQVLPLFFKEYFGCEPFELGVNILSVGGYGKYKPFLRVAKDLDIELFILSDGEKKVVRDLKKHYGKIYEVDTDDNIIDERIKFLPEENDFEKYLVSNGYTEELLEVIDKIEGTKNYLDKYIQNNNGTKRKRQATEQVCPECKQNIFDAPIRNYDGDEGFKEALLEYLSAHKTEYSSLIGDVILKRKDKTKIPQIIQELFYEISKIKPLSIEPLFKLSREEQA